MQFLFEKKEKRKKSLKQRTAFRTNSAFLFHMHDDHRYKRLYTSRVAHQTGSYLRCQYHEATRSISTPSWMGY